jgi:hypothetical protein
VIFMKYKITITQIQEKEVMEEVYFSTEQLEELGEDADRGKYRKMMIKKEIKDDIYEQTRESEKFNLKKIIYAFNEE